MKRITFKMVSTEAKLLLIGIPVFLWTIIPIYHMILFAISPRDQATSGRLWPKNPTLDNFVFVFGQKHFLTTRALPTPTSTSRPSKTVPTVPWRSAGAPTSRSSCFPTVLTSSNRQI